VYKVLKVHLAHLVHLVQAALPATRAAQALKEAQDSGAQLVLQGRWVPQGRWGLLAPGVMLDPRVVVGQQARQVCLGRQV